MSTMKPEPIAGPEAWLGADMARSTEWIRTVSAPAAAEMHAALRGLERRGLAWPLFGRDDFPLPTFSRELSSVLDELEHGRGFVLLRGIPVYRYTPDELKNLYWGLGAHLGRPRYQNAQGELIGEVRDENRLYGEVREAVDGRDARPLLALEGALERAAPLPHRPLRRREPPVRAQGDARAGSAGS